MHNLDVSNIFYAQTVEEVGALIETKRRRHNSILTHSCKKILPEGLEKPRGQNKTKGT